MYLCLLSIEHPFDFISKRSYSYSIRDSLLNGNSFTNGSVRAKLALHASLKSTNKKRRKQKHTDLPKGKISSPSSSSREVGTRKPLGRSISQDELTTHLNSEVNYGKRRPVGSQTRDRGVIEADIDDTTKDVNDRQREHKFFLQQLNNRPTLVLNANYLVSRRPSSLSAFGNLEENASERVQLFGNPFLWI